MGLSLDQVENLNYEDVTEYLGESVDSGFFENLKGTLIDELKEAQCQTILQDLQNQLSGGNRVWLKTNFPESVFEIDVESRVVHIYLDGRAASEEGEE